MREILFRGKRVDNGEWVEGIFSPYNWSVFLEREKKPQIIILSDNKSIDGLWCEVIPETVGQYTGMTDKNGKKIFEGDISKGKTVNGKQINYVFWFDETERAFMYGSSYKGGYRLSLSAYQLSTNEFEVIGNIYDNPELIEQED